MISTGIQNSTEDSRPRRPCQGVVLYVGLDPLAARAHGTTLLELVETLQEFARELLPSSETLAALSMTDDGPTAEAVHAVRAALERKGAA